MNIMHVVQNIQTLREEHGYRQEDMVEYVKAFTGLPISQPVISKLETGLRVEFNEAIIILDALCHAFKLSPNDLLMWRGAHTVADQENAEVNTGE